MTFAGILTILVAADEIPVGDSTVQTVPFHCWALAREMRYCVALPKPPVGEPPSDRPFLLLLHGRGRNRESLLKDPTTQAALRGLAFVVVLPDGKDGWYVDSPARTDDRYEYYLLEFLKDAEKRFGLGADPNLRAVAGWSMGGYGAVRFAQAHRGYFGVVASVIGLLDFPREGLPAGQSYPVPKERFGAAPAAWPRYNPFNAAARLRGKRLFFLTASDAFDRTMNVSYSKELQRLGLDHEFHELDGRHTFAV